jgi:trigger factor
LVEIKISVEQNEVTSILEKTAQEISKEKPIDGYRPGKAGYEAVAKHFGEQAIYEAALSKIVQRYYVQAVKDNNLKTYGEPKIEVTKLAPGNAIEFTATVSVVPEITDLPDLSTIKIETHPVVVEDKEIDGTIRELQKMQTKEVRVNREVGDKDKIIVDLDLKKDGVAIEGGQAIGHGIYLDEEYYVPGLKEQVLGMKEGETREFTLKFPKEHFQKMLAGAPVDIKITVKEIFELQHPTIDDEFAKSLGQESLAKLRELLHSNILNDKTQKEAERIEVAALEKIISKSRFSDLPEQMINNEVDRMLHELKHNIADRGVKFEEYLQNIKKSVDELKLEFAKQAIQRIKSALVIREFGQRENIEVADTEVMQEVEKLLNRYTDNAEAQKTIRDEDYQDYIRTTLRNRKIIRVIKEKIQIIKK